LRLGFKETGSSKIISNAGCITLQKGRSNTTWSDQQIKKVLFFIDDEQAQATLEELLNHFVSTRGFPQINLATLWSYLEDQLITVKGAATHNQNAIAKRIKEFELILRYGFLRTLLALFDPSMNSDSISIHPL
jgi:hypothetical protein